MRQNEKAFAMHIVRFNTAAAEYSLQDMINRFERVKQNSDLNSVILESQHRYGLKNIAYLGYNFGDLSKLEPFSLVTYSQNWVNHYRAKNYVEVDPVLKEVRKSIFPVDWRNIEIKTKKAKTFFNEAFEAGVGRYGLSIPVQGRNNDYSVLSITFDESLCDWNFFKNCYVRDFQILALYFHKTILDINNIKPPSFDLSGREIEVLYWSACGKSGDEVAIILGISKSTVRFHVANIMTKLNAVNMTHAVGKGVFHGLIK